MATDTLPAIVNRNPTAYTIHPARYAKGKYVIQPLDSRDGWKGDASYACDELNLKYVHRSHGYTASPAQAERFQALYEWRVEERAQRAAL